MKKYQLKKAKSNLTVSIFQEKLSMTEAKTDVIT